jgi:hypothetical protein
MAHTIAILGSCDVSLVSILWDMAETILEYLFIPRACNVECCVRIMADHVL